MAITHHFKGSCKGSGYGYFAFIENGELVIGESWPHEGGEIYRGSYAEATNILRTLEKEATALFNSITKYFMEYSSKAHSNFKYNVGDRITFKMKESSSVIPLEKRGRSGVVVALENYQGPCYRLEGDQRLYSESCFAGKTKQLPADQKLEAEWLYSEVDPVFICSNCSFAALNDYRGHSTASMFCPHCGKYMINHQQVED